MAVDDTAILNTDSFPDRTPDSESLTLLNLKSPLPPSLPSTGTHDASEEQSPRWHQAMETTEAIIPVLGMMQSNRGRPGSDNTPPLMHHTC